MARGSCNRRELAERWRGILEAEAEDDDDGKGEGSDRALKSVHSLKERW